VADGADEALEAGADESRADALPDDDPHVPVAPVTPV
jgi:hypothetical protein